MYVVGIFPALATWWIRRGINEPEKWMASDQKRREAVAARNRGETLDEPSRHLVRFTLFDLFANSATRRLTIAAFLMSTTTTLGWWGISTWVPAYVSSVAAESRTVRSAMGKPRRNVLQHRRDLRIYRAWFHCGCMGPQAVDNRLVCSGSSLDARPVFMDAQLSAAFGRLRD